MPDPTMPDTTQLDNAGRTRPEPVIAVFAHNDGARIDKLAADLARQSVTPARPELHFLLNAGDQETRSAVRRAADTLDRGYRVTVHDWAAPGKSRTWRRWVSESDAPAHAPVIFMDGDIRIPDETCLERLLQALRTGRSQVAAACPSRSSRPPGPRSPARWCADSSSGWAAPPTT